jgi:hypothetical protein
MRESTKYAIRTTLNISNVLLAFFLWFSLVIKIPNPFDHYEFYKKNESFSLFIDVSYFLIVAFLSYSFFYFLFHINKVRKIEKGAIAFKTIKILLTLIMATIIATPLCIFMASTASMILRLVGGIAIGVVGSIFFVFVAYFICVSISLLIAWGIVKLIFRKRNR